MSLIKDNIINFLKSAYYEKLDVIVKRAVGNIKIGKIFLFHVDKGFDAVPAGSRSDKTIKRKLEYNRIRNDWWRELSDLSGELNNAIKDIIFNAEYETDEEQVEIMIKSGDVWVYIKNFTIEKPIKEQFAVVIVRKGFKEINKELGEIKERLKKALKRYFDFFSGKELNLNENKVDELVKIIQKSATTPDYINYLLTGEIT